MSNEKAPERKEEERLRKRVEYFYGRKKGLGKRVDVGKHPGVRTPALFEDVDVGNGAWRESGD